MSEAKRYVIATLEAAERYKAEVGDVAALELNPEEERAVVCAGWLEPVTKEHK